jgi:diguanylate cyclase (GGDEF)-like protein
MSRFRFIARHTPQSLALLTLCSLGPMNAFAACFLNPNGSFRDLHALAAKDPRAALARAESGLRAAERDSPANPRTLAAFHAIQAESYSALELDAEARDAASKGLRLINDKTDPIYIDLLTNQAENVYNDDGLETAVATIGAARAAQSPGSIVDTCLLITLGTLQFRQDHADRAVISLTGAYRVSQLPGRSEQRILAAEALSSVMRTMGDYTQALALNQEVIDWNATHGSTLRLSVSHYLRGSTLLAKGDYAEAMKEYSAARVLSAELGDKQGIAFADVNTCESLIKLGRMREAQPRCQDALKAFTETQSTDMVKQTRALLANIDLVEGRTAQALSTLDEVLDRNGGDLGARRVASVYELRARANATLHHYGAAYSDLSEHVKRYVAVNDVDRSRQAAALRAHFEVDRELERNATLQHELALAKEHAQRQKQLLRWMVIAIVAGVLLTALLIYVLVTNLLHKRDLERLARQDGLTGLPNRRHTTELAQAALEAAASAKDRVLTAAVIDLDHFKIINDRCGHAQGDFVLKEFASLARQCLRSTDIFGRWGGEEFLLVLPDTTLDVAVGILERIRLRALDINLPASGAGLRVTLSAGLATNESVGSLDDLIARADAALYEAKHHGRDLVRISDENLRTVSTGVRRAIGIR